MLSCRFTRHKERRSCYLSESAPIESCRAVEKQKKSPACDPALSLRGFEPPCRSIPRKSSPVECQRADSLPVNHISREGPPGFCPCKIGAISGATLGPK